MGAERFNVDVSPRRLKVLFLENAGLGLPETESEVTLDTPRIELNTNFYRFLIDDATPVLASLASGPHWTEDGSRLRLNWESIP